MAQKDSSAHRRVDIYADHVVFQRYEIIAERDIERARESMEHEPVFGADIDVVDSSCEGQILMSFVYKRLSQAR